MLPYVNPKRRAAPVHQSVLTPLVQRFTRTLERQCEREGVSVARLVVHPDSPPVGLDDESAELVRQCNALRQEEIIEEIEVILLSAASLDEE